MNHIADGHVADFDPAADSTSDSTRRPGAAARLLAAAPPAPRRRGPVGADLLRAFGSFGRRYRVTIGPTSDVRHDDPQLSADHRLVLTILRRRIGGSTVQALADASGLPAAVARECLDAMQKEGLVCRETARLLWGYGTRVGELWKLSLSERCLDVLATLPRPAGAPGPAPERVPPQFWSLFSSGTHPAELSLPADAVTVAGRMIDSEDTAARAWALSNLPLTALRTLRTMRGYDADPTAGRIDVALAHRTEP